MDDYDGNGNCTELFQLFDKNGNGFLGWWEIIQNAAIAVLGITSTDHWQQKIEQIDCSVCLQNASYYYW